MRVRTSYVTTRSIGSGDGRRRQREREGSTRGERANSDGYSGVEASRNPRHLLELALASPNVTCLSAPARHAPQHLHYLYFPQHFTYLTVGHRRRSQAPQAVVPVPVAMTVAVAVSAVAPLAPSFARAPRGPARASHSQIHSFLTRDSIMPGRAGLA